MASLTRRPRLRDILYDLLLYCAEERTFEEAEAFVASHAAYRASDSSPHTVASILVRSGALDRLAYDAQGEPVTEERLLELQQTGATQEELEDLVASESLIVSEAGQEAADRFDPRQRVLGLLDEGPERANAYRRLLEKLAQSPCHFGALDETLRPALAALPPTADGQRLQTGFFVDALSAADAIRWTAAAGWNVTEAGRELLEALQASANQ